MTSRSTRPISAAPDRNLVPPRFVSSLAGCTTAWFSYFLRWGLPIAALLAGRASLRKSVDVWSRLQAPEEARARRVNAAQFLGVLGVAKLRVGRGKWWRPAVPLVAFVFPAWAVFASARALRFRTTRGPANVPAAVQFLEQLEMYLRRPALLFMAERQDWYYRKRLSRAQRGEAWKASYPNIGLLVAIANALAGRFDPLGGKDAQATRLTERGVPTIETIGTFGAGQSAFTAPHAKSSPVRRPLFAKPVLGKQGKGAKAWTYEGDDRYRGNDGKVVGWSELIDRLTNEKEPHILQPRLKNHPDLADLVGDALATARIVTYIDPRTREPKVFSMPEMKIPRAGAIADNVHAVGANGAALCSSVDARTGELGAGFDDDDCTLHATHPDFGTPITGRVLPGWDRMLATAKDAQRAFSPEFVAVGWDIAMTEGGPVVVEGNPAPGMPEDVAQDRWFVDLEDFDALVDLCFAAEAKTI